jgi:ubiquinone/menaquinone biosynthesis C-methylase UbiE
MQNQKNIIDCYDKTAKNYADKYIDELSKKHFDRILLELFALENKDSGKTIDLGCGPGQTTKYLYDCGLTNIVGIDISSQMVTVAKQISPHLNFKVADVLKLKYADSYFSSAIAFYTIVHFDHKQLKTAFGEIKRILANDGQFLFSFHIGNNFVHLDTFLGHKVNIDFYFFETNEIIRLVTESGFEIIDVIERQPYEDVEYPSRRAYIWTKKATAR